MACPWRSYPALTFYIRQWTNMVIGHNHKLRTCWRPYWMNMDDRAERVLRDWRLHCSQSLDWRILCVQVQTSRSNGSVEDNTEWWLFAGIQVWNYLALTDLYYVLSMDLSVCLLCSCFVHNAMTDAYKGRRASRRCFVYTTRRQAVARIADHTLPHSRLSSY